MTAQSNIVVSGSKITRSFFGTTSNGEEISSFKVVNCNNIELRVINYGGIITHLFTPDKENKFQDIVLGFDSIEGYQNGSPYFGALVGRYANRIAKGKFKIQEKKYQLAINNIGNHLHGGNIGFDKVFWEINEIEFKNDKALKLNYRSIDGEEGYPGNLDVEVIYYLSPANELEIHYNAVTDQETIINLTQHTYFNLSGNLNQSILDHEMMINADSFLPINNTLIPTTEFRPVSGTPFDFRNAGKIKDLINQQDEQLLFAGGFDHCWVLKRDKEISFAASAYDPQSGRKIEVYTTEPGIQFYSGNFLDGTLVGKGNLKYAYRSGFCLETEHFPDSPNNPDFPSVFLSPGQKFSSTTIYKFS